jgi:hypothetical protein
VSTMRVTNLRNESSTVDQIVLNADGSFGGELASTLGSKQADVMTTKGDLAAFGTAVARLGVGSNGAVLTADSAATLGLRWSAGQKILQIVRSTDATSRSTTSTSMTDASVSVTITPQKDNSAVLLLWILNASNTSNEGMQAQITDNSNNAISGGENMILRSNTATTATFQGPLTVIAYATPSTTSAVTYKGRFRSSTGGSVTIANATNTGQLYAIEVSA